MTRPVDFDHVSFAVPAALPVAARLRSRFGAVPICGERLGEFAYLLLDLGTTLDAIRVELLEPTGDGFLTRFLSKHGSGPHHLTFMVDDLPAAVARARDHGLSITGESYDYEPWQEAFILPTPATGCVIQLAQSSRGYPSRAALRQTNERDVAHYPSSFGAVDQRWWEPLWDTPPGAEVPCTGVAMSSSQPDAVAAIFTEVLQAEDPGRGDVTRRFHWPNGSIDVRHADRSGITGVLLPADGETAGLLEA